MLARIIAPLPSMVGSQPRRPPVSFGKRADEILAERGVSDADLWKVLAAWVHAPSEEAFSHHLGMVLPWSPFEARSLWREMRLP